MDFPIDFQMIGQITVVLSQPELMSFETAICIMSFKIDIFSDFLSIKTYKIEATVIDFSIRQSAGTKI